MGIFWLVCAWIFARFVVGFWSWWLLCGGDWVFFFSFFNGLWLGLWLVCWLIFAGILVGLGSRWLVCGGGVDERVVVVWRCG